MRSTANCLILVIGMSSSFGCAGGNVVVPEQEEQEMEKSSSRVPAPVVAPISSNGVRYEQVQNGLLAGFDQMGGYLAAYDEAGGEQLWTLKVYENRRDPEREGDVQGVFFSSMTFGEAGTLLIENERGARFIVDPASRTVTPAP
jgi:hypothetical protein